MKVGMVAVTATRGGPRTYALSLLRALALLDGPESYALLADDPQAEPDIAGIERVQVPYLGKLLRPIVDPLALPRLARKTGCNVVHGTKQTLPPRLPCPAVATIHDICPHLFPETFPKASGEWLRRSTESAIERADHLIAVSQNTRKDLVEHLGVAPDRVTVVGHGIHERFATPHAATDIAAMRGRLDLPERYLLTVGTIQPRKNVDIVLDALDRLAAGGRTIPPLVLVGRVGWMSDDVLARAEASPHVLRRGEVPEADLPLLYAGADVFVSPSSYEGFGFTWAEAMACGTAVIAGTGSSCDEVIGDAGILLEPRNVEAVADAIDGLVTDDVAREALAQAGHERALQFTWDACARATRDVYRRVAEASA